jgi:DNA-binding response OmpR family regulator
MKEREISSDISIKIVLVEREFLGIVSGDDNVIRRDLTGANISILWHLAHATKPVNARALELLVNGENLEESGTNSTISALVYQLRENLHPIEIIQSTINDGYRIPEEIKRNLRFVESHEYPRTLFKARNSDIGSASKHIKAGSESSNIILNPTAGIKSVRKLTQKEFEEFEEFEELDKKELVVSANLDIKKKTLSFKDTNLQLSKDQFRLLTILLRSKNIPVKLYDIFYNDRITEPEETIKSLLLFHLAMKLDSPLCLYEDFELKLNPRIIIKYEESEFEEEDVLEATRRRIIKTIRRSSKQIIKNTARRSMGMDATSRNILQRINQLPEPFQEALLIQLFESVFNQSGEEVNSRIENGLNRQDRTYLVKGNPIALTAQEYRLLELFSSNEDNLVPDEVFRRLGLATEDSKKIQALIYKLRRKIFNNPQCEYQIRRVGEHGYIYEKIPIETSS